MPVGFDSPERKFLMSCSWPFANFLIPVPGHSATAEEIHLHIMLSDLWTH